MGEKDGVGSGLVVEVGVLSSFCVYSFLGFLAPAPPPSLENGWLVEWTAGTTVMTGMRIIADGDGLTLILREHRFR